MKNSTFSRSCAMVLLAVAALVFLPSVTASGANGADKDFIRLKTKEAAMQVAEGEVEVTLETGETMTYKAGDEIPPLPDGAIIKILSGNATLMAGNAEVDLSEGDSVCLFVDATYRMTSVQLPGDYEGELTVQAEGTTQTLAAGDTYWAPTSGSGETSSESKSSNTGSEKKEEADSKKSSGSKEDKVVTDTDKMEIQLFSTTQDTQETSEVFHVLDYSSDSRRPGSYSGQ